MEANDDVLMCSILENAISDLTKRIYHTLQEESTITIAQFLILSYLCTCDNISHNTLCVLTSKDKPSISRLIDKLESKKYVQRIPDAIDKRKKLIILTKDGRIACVKTKNIIKQISGKIIANIDNNQLKVFWNVLNKLINNL